MSEQELESRVRSPIRMLVFAGGNGSLVGLLLRGVTMATTLTCAYAGPSH
jgi:hypothetical protein